MTEKDAIQAIDDALAEVRAREHALEDLKAAVRRAHQLGYPQAAIARRTGFHPNTIRNWCVEEED